MFAPECKPVLFAYDGVEGKSMPPLLLGPRRLYMVLATNHIEEISIGKDIPSRPTTPRPMTPWSISPDTHSHSHPHPTPPRPWINRRPPSSPSLVNRLPHPLSRRSCIRLPLPLNLSAFGCILAKVIKGDICACIFLIRLFSNKHLWDKVIIFRTARSRPIPLSSPPRLRSRRSATRHITLCIWPSLPPPNQLATRPIPKIKISPNPILIKSHAYIAPLADTHDCLVPPILHQPVPARGEGLAGKRFREASASFGVLDREIGDDF